MNNTITRRHAKRNHIVEASEHTIEKPRGSRLLGPLSKTIRSMIFLGLALASFAAIAHINPVSAQAEERINDFSRPGRPTILVYVWGTSSSPGIWRVEQDVDLIQLLSAAMVPGMGVVEQTKKQTINLRIYRPTGGRRVEIYESELTKMITEGGGYPSLQDGDILYLETVIKNRFSFQTIFSAVGAAASLTLLVIRLNQI